MQPSRDQVLARERAWALPVAIATLAAIALLVAATIVVGPVGGDGDAEVLRSVEEHSSAVTISGVLQALGFLLLAAPLVYLFRAAQARSERVRGQLIGLFIAAPVFLCVAAILTSVSATDAASEFEAGRATADLSRSEASEECRSEQSDDAASFREEYGAGKGDSAVGRCATTAIADDEAENALTDASARSIGLGFGLGGRLGLAFALLYGCLWAMRVGLLSRFWGSLGMAMGAAALLLRIEFPLVWFFYFALLIAGWVPGGRPPAWAAGEAIPWPTPGEKAADELSPSEEPENPADEGQPR